MKPRLAGHDDLPERAALGSLRLTTGIGTTDEEIDEVLAALPEIVARVRALAPVTSS